MSTLEWVHFDLLFKNSTFLVLFLLPLKLRIATRNFFYNRLIYEYENSVRKVAIQKKKVRYTENTVNVQTGVPKRGKLRRAQDWH